MKKMSFLVILASLAAMIAVITVIGPVLSSHALAQAQSQPQQPPEYKDVVAASRIQDLAAKLKELERIKAAYPNSQYMATIDGWMLAARIGLSDTLEAVLGLQKDYLAKVKGPDRVQGPFMSADQLISHPKVLMFDKARILAAILGYKEAVAKALSEADSLQGIPPDQQKSFKTYFQSGIDVFVAQAQLNAGDAVKALASLESYRAAGGAADGRYSFVLAQANAKLGKTKEAYDGFMSAAAENYPNSIDNAKALYAKLNGKADGFEAALEAKIKALPFHPEPFKPGAEWKGKAVLAEIFTGSECPPCVAADLGFDGLIEAYPIKYVAVLEYHLPIPRPDPIMNPASKKRQDYYAVNSTPTVFFDGEKKSGGGGSRGMAEAKFKEYRAEVDTRVNAAPAVVLGVKAARTGDVVKVDCTADKAAPGVEYYVVLVQGEEKYKGSNGIVFHKLVVRDLVVLDPAAAKTTSFDLAASELAADAYLTDFEKTSSRFPNFKFPERHAKIDRAKLRIVYFAQEKESKKVLNAVVADVK